jgi:hypothetical protein
MLRTNISILVVRLPFVFQVGFDISWAECTWSRMWWHTLDVRVRILYFILWVYVCNCVPKHTQVRYNMKTQVQQNKYQNKLK